MRACTFFILLLLFRIPSAHASSTYDGIFKILDERYVENASDLPPVTNLNPDETMSPSSTWFDEHCSGDSSNDCVWGWFDIVGFKNTVRIGNDYYVQGDPADSAIIQYKTYVRINGRYLFKNWIYDLQKTESNGVLTARLQATAVLYQIDKSGYISYEYPSYTFSKSALEPKQYPVLKEPQVIITQYNNSMYENIGIKILGDNYTKITFDYKDKHAERTFQILHVENNSKGLVYGNTTELDQWEIEGPGISRFYNEILVDENLSKTDINEFDIRAYNAFGSIKANPSNFTIRREEFAPAKSFSPLFFGFIGIIGVLTKGTIFLLRRLNKWHIKLF
jgi:hypothetical protein